MNSVATRVLVGSAFTITMVGSIDAFASQEWDLFALFIAASTIHAMLYLRQGAKRRAVTLRPDLAHWIEHRSEIGGEPPEDVLDRAVATFKHGLYADDRRD